MVVLGDPKLKLHLAVGIVGGIRVPYWYTLVVMYCDYVTATCVSYYYAHTMMMSIHEVYFKIHYPPRFCSIGWIKRLLYLFFDNHSTATKLVQLLLIIWALIVWNFSTHWHGDWHGGCKDIGLVMVRASWPTSCLPRSGGVRFARRLLDSGCHDSVVSGCQHTIP